VIKILVVDDEPSYSGIISEILEDAGYRIFVAANGREALEALADLMPDLIISDYMMPIMDGATFANQVRATTTHRYVAIIMMSGLSEEAVRNRFSDYQAFLQKPFFESTLLDAVSHVLARKA
jgi:CheY-like chemotaxis protein